MIPNPEQLLAISQLREGDLAQIPFAVLLHALAAHERSAVIEIERRPLKKSVILETGVPVDCRSNLLHETLGRFMVAQGLLSEDQYQIYLGKSASQGVVFGEVLTEEGVVSASDLFRILQQNLAKKLLDPFSWRTGHFRVVTDMPEVDSPLKVKAPQLVVTGISKFSSQDEVNGAIGPLVGKRLFLHPSPPFAVGDIHLSAAQKELVGLLEGGKRVDELAAESSVPFDDIMRLLYSLAVIGIVVPEEWMPAQPKPRPEKPTAAQGPPLIEVDPKELKNDLMNVYLKHRKQDSFDLLGLSEEATALDVEQAFLDFVGKFAPVRLKAAGLASLREKAEDLLLAAGRSYGELCDRDRRLALLQRRKTLREEKKKRPDPERFAIKSDLLDSEQQFKKGKALAAAGHLREGIQQLQFAADCDPQNSLYRSELAYAKWRHRPDLDTEFALENLREALRIDPKCGVAHLYLGEVLGDEGDLDTAEKHLRRAIKLLSPDRRPIEALKGLAAKGRKGKRR